MKSFVKSLIVFLLVYVALFCLAYVGATQEIPVIILPVDKDKLSSVTLVVYKQFGAIGGYIVFRDKSGKMCSIKTQTWHGKLTVPYDSRYPSTNCYEREIDFSPEKFKRVTTRGGDELWACPLDPIPLDSEKIKTENPTVYFKLELTDWLVSDVAY